MTEDFQVSSNDVAKAVNIRPDQADKGILEVYNLLISQKPFNELVHTIDEFDKLIDFSPNWVTYGQCNHFMLKAPNGFGLVLATWKRQNALSSYLYLKHSLYP